MSPINIWCEVRKMAVTRPLGDVRTKQEWNIRWLFILIATALLAGTTGYAAGGGGRSEASVLTGNAYAGIGQVSAQASDGFAYSIPVDGSWWTDSKGSLHSNGRPECLPPVG